MSSNIVNGMPYLITTRIFPEDLKKLTTEMGRAYIDIANSVNDRVIGIFPTSRPALTGESWFLQGSRQYQTLRQLYIFTTAGTYPHGINFNSVLQITPKTSGSYTDGTNWYGAIYSTSHAPPAGQVTFYITPTNIIIQADAAAPAITSITIILEWLSTV